MYLVSCKLLGLYTVHTLPITKTKKCVTINKKYTPQVTTIKNKFLGLNVPSSIIQNVMISNIILNNKVCAYEMSLAHVYKREWQLIKKKRQCNQVQSYETIDVMFREFCVQQGLEDEHLGLVSPSAHPHPPVRKVKKPSPVHHTALSQGLDLDQRSPPKSGANPNLLSPMSPVQQSLAMQTMLSDLATPNSTNPRSQGWLAKKVQIFYLSPKNELPPFLTIIGLLEEVSVRLT